MLITLTLVTILLAFAAGWAVCDELKDRRAEREAAAARRAEAACDELRRSLMRGSAVAVWTWPRAASRPPAADTYYLHLRAAGDNLFLTTEAYDEARERAARLLSGAPPASPT